jgi:hypothetical protein
MQCTLVMVTVCALCLLKNIHKHCLQAVPNVPGQGAAGVWRVKPAIAMNNCMELKIGPQQIPHRIICWAFSMILQFNVETISDSQLEEL